MFKGINEDDDNVDLFTQSDWGISKAGNTPAAICRSMMRDRGFTPGVLESCTNLWVRHFTDNDKHRSSTKSNILRAIKKPLMSLGTLQRFIGIARIKHVTYHVTTTWYDDVVTISKHDVPGDQNFLDLTDLAKELVNNGIDLDTLEYATNEVETNIRDVIKLSQAIKASGRDIKVIIDDNEVIL